MVVWKEGLAAAVAAAVKRVGEMAAGWEVVAAEAAAGGVENNATTPRAARSRRRTASNCRGGKCSTRPSLRCA